MFHFGRNVVIFFEIARSQLKKTGLVQSVNYNFHGYPMNMYFAPIRPQTCSHYKFKPALKKKVFFCNTFLHLQKF